MSTKEPIKQLIDLYQITYFTMLGVDFLPLIAIILLSLKNRSVILSGIYITFFSCTVLVQWMTYYFAINSLSSIWITNLYVFTELLLLYFIYRNRNQVRIFRRFQFYSMLIFLILFYTEFSTDKFMQNSYLVSSFFILFWSVYSIIMSLYDHNLANKISDFDKYFNFGILFYFSVTIIFFILFDQINSRNYLIWTFHNILEILTILILTVAICTIPSKSIS